MPAAGGAQARLEGPLPFTAERFAGLDGIRGIAAVLVLMTHTFPIALYKETLLSPLAYVAEYGWLGIELFFVLSGFLITGILRANRTATNYFRAFYWHRTLRVFPLYFALVAMCLIAIPALSPATDHLLWVKGESSGLLPYWLFLSNLGCCIDVSPHRLLAVCWSLAIEEQFYLFWALCVYSLSTRGLVAVALTFVFLGPLLRWYLPAAALMTVSETFYFTLAHFDGIALGALCSILHDSRPAIARRLGRLWMGWLIPFAAVCVATELSANGFHSAYRAPMMLIGISVAGLLFGSMILYLVTAQSRLRQILEFRPFKVLGSISYFMYLFHLVVHSFPLYLFARAGYLANMFAYELWGIHYITQDFSHPLFRFAETAVVLVVAGWLSFRFIESPILRLKKLIPYRFSRQVVPGEAIWVEPIKGAR